jgi:hypothetical protein
MPTGPLIGVNLIVNTVLSLEPRRILDLGMGTGKWGFLIREQSDLAEGRNDRREWKLTIDGVEAYEPYIGAHQRSVYDTVHVADVREFLLSYRGEKYDVVLALDIIEHFDPGAAVEFVAEALGVARFCVISTPKGFYPQEGHANVLETHRSWWPPSALRKLATACGANVALAQLRMVNVAIVSRDATPPKLRVGRVLDATAFVKDHLLPHEVYYRALHRAGPSILD